MQEAANSDPVVKTLMQALEENPNYRFSERDLVRMRLDPSTVRRSFKRNFGMTFLEIARHRRLGAGFTTLAHGGPVILAQLEAGFESPSAFRTAFAKLLGQSPNSFVKNALLKADWIETPLGPMVAVCDPQSLHLLEFIDRKALPNALKRLKSAAKGSLGIGSYMIHDQLREELRQFFSGERGQFTVPLTMHGSEFTKLVWCTLRKIGAGRTESYSAIASKLGKPNAVRAVARANGANQIALLVPCHRVIGADGSLTGYGGGLWRKQRLIELECRYRNQEDT